MTEKEKAKEREKGGKIEEVKGKEGEILDQQTIGQSFKIYSYGIILNNGLQIED